jgi:hypothetical protein
MCTCSPTPLAYSSWQKLYSSAPRSLIGGPGALCDQLLQPPKFVSLGPYEALDGTSTCFLRHLRRGRGGHWRRAGSLTTAVPAALMLPRSGSSVDVDILVRQDINNAHASKLFLQECRNLPVGYECTSERAEHVEALYFAIGQPTVAPLRARGATEAPKIHTHCGRLIPSAV